MSAASQSPDEINRILYPQLQVYRSIQGINEIREEHVKAYKDQGFLGVEGVLSAAEVNRAVEAIMHHVYDDATQAGVQFVRPRNELLNQEERELSVRKVYNFVEVDQTLRTIAYQPDLLAIVERLLGEKPVLVQNMALMKPPKGGGEKPWHQDMAYGNLAYDRSVVGAWIALDEAGLDNGCMQVIPKSHMDGGTPHYAIRDWQICDANVPVQRNVSIPLQPGGVLFFHGLLMHGTPFNFSDKRRRALQFHYAPESAEKIPSEEYNRIFTNEMTGAEC
jgi:phytanoyl-CoA hydroxylase